MTVLHWVETGVARAVLWVLRRLGPVRSSDLCGAVARAVGPMLPVSAVADRNLRLALPGLDAGARRAVVRGVWDNLGRTAGEFVHVGGLSETAQGPGWEIAGAEHIEALGARGGPALLFTGHLGNWEILSLATARRGVEVAALYRPSDNAGIDALILELRRAAPGVNEKLFPKGAQGARQAIAHLRQGGFLALLQDQKMTDGVEARLFGHAAMTASALAALALRFRCPVLPAYAQRIGPMRFRVTYEAPMSLPRSGDRAADVLALTQAANDRLEAWITAAPESWLWLHRRWPKAVYTVRR